MPNQPKRSKIVLMISTTVAVIVLLLTALYTLEQISQKATANSSVPYSRQATTTPISNTKVTLRLHFDSGRYYDAMQCEGGLVRLEQNGSVLGLSPYLDGEEVKIKVFKIFRLKNQDGPVAEGLSELNEVFLVNKAPIRVGDEKLGLGVEVVNIQKAEVDSDQNSPLSSKSPSPFTTQMAGGQCCITCPPDPKVCSSVVHAPCGDCCSCPNSN